MKLTLGLSAFAGLGAATSHCPDLDLYLCAGIGGGVVLTGLYGAAHWVLGEWSLNRLCTCPHVEPPAQTPRYWPGRERVDG